MKKPIVWTIAGSDSGGGAGIQADLHTFKNFNVHGCSVVTAITSQNTLSIDAIYYLPASHIDSQITSLSNDLTPSAIKCGMLGLIASITTIKHFFMHYTGKMVLDPVLISTSGTLLFESEINEYLSAIKNIFPYLDIVTPNLHEAEMISNQKIHSLKDVKKAADILLSFGVKSVLIKGGHLNHPEESSDFWSNGSESFWLTSKRVTHHPYHGTGCTLSAAITASLALGYNIKDALVMAKRYISNTILKAETHGRGLATLEHSPAENRCDFPMVSKNPSIPSHHYFPPLGGRSLGLYPVVDHVSWLKKLLPLGITTIQLRIKDKPADLEHQIKEAVLIANKFNTRLFINDYWELAIYYGAYGVHLGQDDIASTDIQHIVKSGLRLGISTHCYVEVAKAHALKPSYIACGPIFHTTSKAMPFKPQGIIELKRWCRTLDYPIVAIGGIDILNLASVLTAGADGIAMISSITRSHQPLLMTRQLLKKITAYRLYQYNISRLTNEVIHGRNTNEEPGRA